MLRSQVSGGALNLDRTGLRRFRWFRSCPFASSQEQNESAQARPDPEIRNGHGQETRPRYASRFRGPEFFQDRVAPREAGDLGFRPIPAGARGFEPLLLRVRLREQLLKIGLNGSSRSGGSQSQNQQRSWKPMPRKYFHSFLDAKLLKRISKTEI